MRGNVYRRQVHITIRKGELCQCRLEKSAQPVPPGASFLDESRECEVVQVGTQHILPENIKTKKENFWTSKVIRI